MVVPDALTNPVPFKVGCLVLSKIVIGAVPSKLTPFIALGVDNLIALPEV